MKMSQSLNSTLSQLLKPFLSSSVGPKIKDNGASEKHIMERWNALSSQVLTTDRPAFCLGK